MITINTLMPCYLFLLINVLVTSTNNFKISFKISWLYVVGLWWKMLQKNVAFPKQQHFVYLAVTFNQRLLKCKKFATCNLYYNSSCLLHIFGICVLLYQCLPLLLLPWLFDIFCIALKKIFFSAFYMFVEKTYCA